MDSARLLRRARNTELPFAALPAIRELRSYLDRLETEIVHYAREKGATWDEIAEAIGITRQALYQRMRNRERRSGAKR